MQHSTDSQLAPQGEPIDVTAQPSESTSELVAAIAHDAKHLAEQYAALAKIEVGQVTTEVLRRFAKVVVGGGVLVVGVLFLGIAIGCALSTWTEVPEWAGYGLLAIGALGAGVATLALAWLQPGESPR
jgi:hypothetical protein